MNFGKVREEALEIYDKLSSGVSKAEIEKDHAAFLDNRPKVKDLLFDRSCDRELLKSALGHLGSPEDYARFFFGIFHPDMAEAANSQG